MTNPKQAPVPETFGTHQITCPLCGWVDQDSWEENGGEEGEWEMDCGRCEKPLLVERRVSITFSAKPSEESHD